MPRRDGGICYRGSSDVSNVEESLVFTTQKLHLDSNTMGNIAGVASVAWGGAVQLMAAVSIGSNLTFVPTTAQI